MKARIKVCGITHAEDALFARRLGAWALGFIFYPPSPRYIEPERVREITSRIEGEVEKVGVFVDATEEEIRCAAEAAGLTVIQLHGSESRAFLDSLKPDFNDVWKAFRVKESLAETAVEEFRGCTLLLDAYRRGRPGGTGATFPWEEARRARAFGRVILAGGLNPGNVAEAVKTAVPFALDVSSGVEAAPGKKDHRLLAAFFEEAERAWSALGT